MRKALARGTRGGIVVLTTVLSACATAPADQIRHFSEAFNSVNTVGQPLLDDLAVAERNRGRQIAVRRAQGKSLAGAKDCPPDNVKWEVVAGVTGIIRGFCLQDAAYFSELGDPPAAAAMRGGLSVIERYAGVLSTLAEGRNVEEAVGQIDALGQNVSGLLAVAGVAAGPIGPVLGALKPILESAAREANAKEAKRLILEGAPVVTRLIAALRDAVPEAFNALVEGPANRLSLLDKDQMPAINSEIARVEGYRVAVANYVVLLGKLQDAWDLTVAAANAPPGQVRLVSLVQQTSELKANAEAARKAFSVLRAGGTLAGA
jgi:hypothetical protein